MGSLTSLFLSRYRPCFIPIRRNADNVKLPDAYGDDHILVPEYEYQDFIAPVLRNPRSAVDRQLIPIDRDPLP